METSPVLARSPLKSLILRLAELQSRWTTDAGVPQVGGIVLRGNNLLGEAVEIPLDSTEW